MACETLAVEDLSVSQFRPLICRRTPEKDIFSQGVVERLVRQHRSLSAKQFAMSTLFLTINHSVNRSS